MSKSVSSSTLTAIEIRHGQLPLVVAHLRGPTVEAVVAELEQRYGSSPGFFDQEPVLLDLSHWPLDADSQPTPLQQQMLFEGLQRVGLRPVAYRGAADAWHEALHARGLFPGESVDVPRSGAAVSAGTVASAVPPAPPPVPPTALVIDKPLRSGQQVYARGRDIVVLAMVNPGAEVIADGHVHVYAPLRGRAIAGARGMTDARIFALTLEPELIAIAGVYRTAENPWPEHVRGKPAQVRLASGEQGETLVFDALI